MKQKVEIIKTIEIDDNTILFIGKKIETEPKKCVNCQYMTDYGLVKQIGYCNKYHSIVSADDDCIGEDM